MPLWGLRHRTKLITALKLAEEVQQNLLPISAPRHPGLDLSGTSIYCDETGDRCGLDRLRETVAENSALSALEIQTAVIDRL